MIQLLKPYLLLFSFLLSITAFGQNLTGIVIDEETREVLPGTHVVNKRTFKGDLTNERGQFEIGLRWGDTIVFSNIAYQYFYFIYNDSGTVLNDALVELKEQNYLLDEVSIFSYKLTSNKNREVVLDEPSRPTNEELGDGRIVRAGMNNPAEYLYNLFGSKPRQLRALAQLKAEEAYRQKLEESNNRQSVVRLTGLTREELEAFMFYCKYAPVRMHTMNDYEFLISVQHCYRQYVKERELDSFLKQFD
ncbi:MAG: carboxypeptidase-like regulatory domain-containing protein [Owenweeksia sp.]|nr:carboxypeptidase-like regulatory domain-containing protein [Owenweeksia sp.]